MQREEPTEMSAGWDDPHLLFLFRKGDTRVFETIYDRYSRRLYQYINRRVHIKEVSEEIVQEIFVSLWQKRETVCITTSLEAYLFGAAKFKILTYVRSEIVRKKYASHFALFSKYQFDNSTEEVMDIIDLQHSIEQSIAQLPDRCREAFHLSRVENEPIHIIAKRLNVSRRTVENYLSQALKHLRTSLGQFFTIHVLWLLSWHSGVAILT